MSAATRPVARLSSPGEIAAVVPLLCGFTPTQSLVVVSLRGPTGRIGLTMRFDLDWAAVDPKGFAEQVAGRLALDGAVRTVLVVLTDQAGPGQALPWRDLVDEVGDACLARGTVAQEALLVTGDRWWSYLCADAGCCPPGGTPLSGAPATPAVALVQAERVLGGRVVLASREALAATVAAPVQLAAAAAQQHLRDAVRARSGHDGACLRARDVAAARALLDHVEAGGSVGAGAAAALAVSCGDVHVRDEVATWCLDRHEPLLSLLLQVARRVVPPYDPPVLALVAWTAYAQGDGGLANVALERCLSSDPAYALGVLLRQALDRQLPPRAVRRLLTDLADPSPRRPRG